MDDLRRILANRNDLYAKADVTIDTSGKTVAATFDELRGCIQVSRKAGSSRNC